MDDQLPYLVAFNHISGIGAVRTAILKRVFGTFENAWKAPEAELRKAGLPEKVVSGIREFRGENDPQKLLESIVNKGISLLSIDDEKYPALLKQIDNPPQLLYYVGHIPEQPMKAMAVVGTRRMTSYGQNMARELSAYLASNGVVVVSGLARGVDGEAHQAVLNVDGVTLAVLGSGVDVIYPPEHRTLARGIVQNGAVISEYAPGTRPDKVNFPQRNRIISGMTSACLIIEAGEKSGSLITARFAAEQGREVFVIPGNYNAPQSRGANRLIRDGARPLYEKKELLEFAQTWQSETPPKLSKPLQMSFASDEEQCILESISLEALHVDEIARMTGIPVAKVSSALLMMELKGFVEETAPETFIVKHEIF